MQNAANFPILWVVVIIIGLALLASSIRIVPHQRIFSIELLVAIGDYCARVLTLSFPWLNKLRIKSLCGRANWTLM